MPVDLPRAMIVAGALVALMALGSLVGRQSREEAADGTAPPARERIEAAAAAETEACRRDLVCWAEEHAAAADVECGVAIDRAAGQPTRWTNEWPAPAFPDVRWSDIGRGNLTYLGAALDIRAASGVWIAHSYHCDFDPATSSVLAVGLRPLTNP